MFRKICAGLIALGLTTQAFAGYHMTPRQAFYYHAHKGNLSALQKLKSMGHSVNMNDQYGNSALCESVYQQDYSAFAMLKQVGATTAHPCVSKIPQQTVQQFNQGYANWAQAVNSGQIAYAGASSQTATTTTATAGTATTATVATTTGLSTAAMVGIGVGAAALVGGGIALAAGGGGGGSSSSAPAECSGHGSKNTEAVCVCKDGWTGDDCENKDSSCTGSATSISNCSAQTSCKYGDQTLYTCTTCNAGYTGSTCSSCASGYDKYGTNACHATLNCHNGSQQGDTCQCNTGWKGTYCDTTNTCTSSNTSVTGCDAYTTCTTPTGNFYTCTTCKSGYSKDGDGCKANVCSSTNTSKTGCTSYDSCTSPSGTFYTCKGCSSGYTLTNGVCVANTCTSTNTSKTGCTEYDTCTTPTGNFYTCSACADTYTLTDGVCIATSCSSTNTSKTGCKNYESCTSLAGVFYTCSECDKGYQKSGDSCIKNTCSGVKGTSIANCKTLSTPCYSGEDEYHTCSACNGGYTLSSGTCVANQNPPVENVAGTGYIFKNTSGTGHSVDINFSTYTNNDNISITTKDYATQSPIDASDYINKNWSKWIDRTNFFVFSNVNDTVIPNFINKGTLEIQYSEDDNLQNQAVILSVVNANSTNNATLKATNIGFYVGENTYEGAVSAAYGMLVASPFSDGLGVGDGQEVIEEENRHFSLINNGIINVSTYENLNFSKADALYGDSSNLTAKIMSFQNREQMVNGMHIKNDYIENGYFEGEKSIAELGYLKDLITAKNFGSITIDKGTGTYVEGANFTNENGATIIVGNGIGIQAAIANIINKGTITVNEKLYTGNLYDYSGSGIVAASSNVINTESGTINVTKGYGIYAEDSIVENYGTINVENGVGIKGLGTTTIYNAGTINAPTQIEGNTVTSGQYNSETGLKLTAQSFKAMKNSKTSAKEYISGSATVGTDVVQDGFKTTYIENNMFNAPDTSNLKLVSESALFDAKLADNGSDVVMKMKNFTDVVPNKSLAQFLANNYALANNAEFYNKLKSFDNLSSLNNSLNQLTGKDVLSRFNFEDMSMMRELNYDMNNNLFHSKENHLSMAGSVSPMAFKGDTGSNSRYSLFSQQHDNTSIGLGIAFTDTRSDDDHESNNRHETMYQMIVPFGYKAGGFNMITSPRIGYARGEYDRTGFDGANYDGTLEKRVYGVMNEARYPFKVAGWSFEPSLEFNVLGYQQKGSEDGRQFSLNVPNQQTLSVEGGMGFYATREEELDKDSTLKLTAGVVAYHEFADPYKLRVGMNGMDGAFTLRDENRSDNRGVIRAGFDYVYRDLSLYGSLISYIDREARTSAKTGMKVKF